MMLLFNFFMALATVGFVMQLTYRDPSVDPEMMTEAQSRDRAEEVIRALLADHDGPASLVSEIACEIGAEIVEGMIPPGFDLNTVELSRRYDTSRTPVREALLLLSREGLVDIEPRRRPRAHVPTIPEVREIYRIRIALFEMMAADLAGRATAADIAILAEVLARMRAAVSLADVRRYVWLTVEFHDKASALSGNKTAKRINDSLLLRTIPLRRIAVGIPERLEQSLEDHTLLLRAYQSHDAILAAAILRSNHARGLATIEAHHQRLGGFTPQSAS
jgi:DNA-binding GntR family transcriptional regulator